MAPNQLNLGDIRVDVPTMDETTAAKSVIELLLRYLCEKLDTANNDEFSELVAKHFPGNKWSSNYWHHYRSKVRAGHFDHRLPAHLLIKVKGKHQPPSKAFENAVPANLLAKVEKGLTKALADVAYFLSPHIVAEIAARNEEWVVELQSKFPGAFDTAPWFYKDSASVFGPVRRKQNQNEQPLAPQRYYPRLKAIIDLNWFPREAFAFICTGYRYSAHTWRESGLAQFELAHVLPHKAGEAAAFSWLFKSLPSDPFPTGLFTCAANVALLPKGMARPTDVNGVARAALIHRYIDLYQERFSAGFKGFQLPHGAEWIKDLEWNSCIEPSDWRIRLERLDQFRRKRIAGVIAAGLEQ